MANDGEAVGFARGSAALAVRQGLSAGLGLLGVLLIARIIGSGPYGVYIAAQAYVLVVAALAQWGLGLALVRTRDEPAREQLDSAWLLLVCLGALAAACGCLLSAYLLPGADLAETRSAIAMMLAAQVLSLTGTVPLALLERRMAFRRIAVVELAGQVCWLGLGWLLATLGWGVWSLPVSWMAQQVGLACSWHLLAQHRPGLAWSRQAGRGLLGFGTTYAAAVATWQVRPLVAPAVVGPRLGLDAVGQIGLASRLVEALSMVRQAVWRAGAPMLGKLGEDAVGTARVVCAGGLAAYAATALLCAVFVAASGVVQRLLGSDWGPALAVFPAFAVHALCAALASLVSLALHVRGLSLRVAAFHVVHIAILWSVGLWAVARHGLQGWMAAELAACAAFPLLVAMCPRDLRRELSGLLPPLLLLPGVAWYLFLPGALSAAVCVATLILLGLLAWRHWRILRRGA